MDTKAESTSHQKETTLSDNAERTSILQADKRKNFRRRGYGKRRAKKTKSLIKATRQGDLERVNQLLKDGANLENKDYRGWTVLHEATKKDSEEIVSSLLSNGACINAVDNRGFTPLHRAALWGNSNVVKFLITRGCKLNEEDIFEETALDKAIFWGHSSVVNILIESGARKSCKVASDVTKQRVISARKNIPRSKISDCSKLEKNEVEEMFKDSLKLKPFTENMQKVTGKLIHEQEQKNKEMGQPGYKTVQKDEIEGKRVYGQVQKSKEFRFPGYKTVQKDEIAGKRVYGQVQKSKEFRFPGYKTVQKDEIAGKCVYGQVQKSKEMGHPGYKTVQKDEIEGKRVYGQVQKNKEFRFRGYKTVQKDEIEGKLVYGPVQKSIGGDEFGFPGMFETDKTVSEYFCGIGPVNFDIIQDVSLLNVKVEERLTRKLEKAIEVEMTEKHVYQNVDKDKITGDLFVKNLQSANCGVAQQEIVRVREEKKPHQEKKPVVNRQAGSKPEIKIFASEGSVTKTQSQGKQKMEKVACSVEGDSDLVDSQLLSCNDIDSTDEFNRTALHKASSKGTKSSVEWLMKRGSSLNARDSDNWTPLHWASAKGNLEVVRCLIDGGADIEAVDYVGRTLLHRASMNGKTDVATYLLQNGCRTKVKDIDGLTPLHEAASYGYVDMVELLIAHGADINMVDNLARTPLDVAKAAGHLECTVVLEKQKMQSATKKETQEGKGDMVVSNFSQLQHGEPGINLNPANVCVNERELKQHVKYDPTKECVEKTDKTFDNRHIGRATECTIDEKGGSLSVGHVRLVVPPGSLLKETTIRVNLEDPAEIYSSFDQAGLIDGIVIAHPVIKLEPSAACFIIPVTLSTILPHKPVTGEDLLVLHGFYNEEEPGKYLWEDITDISCFDAKSGTVTTKLAHFSLVMFLYKNVVIRPKVILSWLSLKCLWYRVILACQSSSQTTYSAVKLVFISEDIYKLREEQEDHPKKKLDKEGYRVIRDYHDNRTYVKNGEQLCVTLNVDAGFGMSPEEHSNKKQLTVESSKWWDGGDQMTFKVKGDNASETISGEVVIEKSGSSKNDEVKFSFKAEDWYGYLQNIQTLGEVSDLLPLAYKLGLDESVKTLLIQSWKCDKEQLKKILELCKIRESSKPHSIFKRQLSEVNSLDLEFISTPLENVRVSSRGKMHVENLRKLKTKPEDLGRDPDGDKMRNEISRARKVVYLVLQDSCIEVAENEKEIDRCMASEQFTKFLKCKKQLPDALKKNIDGLLDHRSQFEMIENVLPELIQVVKEVFKCKEEQMPLLNGMRGLPAEFLSKSRRRVEALLAQRNSPCLLSEISKILEKLCATNEQNHRDHDKFNKWSRAMKVDKLLEALGRFFHKANGMKIRKRVEMKAEMMQDIIDGGDQYHLMVQDLANIAETLICFAEFVPGRLVQFEICCQPKEMVQFKVSDSVSGGRRDDIFIQDFILSRKRNCQITLTATARINMDDNVDKHCLELYECTSKETQSLCEDEKTANEHFEEEIELKLVYTHSCRKFTYECHRFTEDHGKVESALALCNSSSSESDLPLDFMTILPIDQASGATGSSNRDIESQDTNSNENYQRALQLFRKESVGTIVNKMLVALKNNSQSSKSDNNKDNRNKIRRFLQFVKSQPVKGVELFSAIRKEVPAGTTGPYLDEHSPLSQLPYGVRQELSDYFFCYDTWKPLAAHIGINNQKIGVMAKKGDPAEQVLKEWEQRGKTVKDLYDTLVELKCELIADLL